MAVGEHMAFLEGQGPPLRPSHESAGQAVLSLQGSIPKAEGIYVVCVYTFPSSCLVSERTTFLTN